MEQEDKLRKVYNVISANPKTKDGYGGVTYDQFKEVLKDNTEAQDAVHSDLVKFDLISTKDPNEYWTKVGLRQPKVAAPPQVSLAPPQRQSIEQQAAGQATGFVPEMPEMPMQQEAIGQPQTGEFDIEMVGGKPRAVAQGMTFGGEKVSGQQVQQQPIGVLQQQKGPDLTQGLQNLVTETPEDKQELARTTERNRMNDEKGVFERYVSDPAKGVWAMFKNTMPGAIKFFGTMDQGGMATATPGGFMPSSGKTAGYDNKEIQKLVKQDTYKTIKQGEEAFGAEIEKLGLQTDIVDAFKSGRPSDVVQSAIYNIGQGLPQMGAALATFGASSFGMEGAESYKNIVEAQADAMGITPEELIASGQDAYALAVYTGVLSAGVDYLGAKMLSRFIGMGGAYENLAKTLASQLPKKYAAPLLARGAVAAGGEGSQETIQEGIKIGGEYLASGKMPKDALGRLGRSFANAAIAGEGMYMGGRAVNAVVSPEGSVTLGTLRNAPIIGQAPRQGGFDAVIIADQINQGKKVDVQSALAADAYLDSEIQRQGENVSPELLEHKKTISDFIEKEGGVIEQTDQQSAETIYEPVTPEELQAFQQGQIDPERAAAIADDVALIQSGQMDINAIDDANYRVMVESALGAGQPVVTAETEIAPIQETQTIQIQPLNIDFRNNEGRNVNYQGIEGRIKIDSDGTPYVFTKDGDVVYIEGGLSGQTPQQLGLQPLADDVVNEADIETVLQDENAPLDQGQLEYNFDNNQLTLYGRPFTYDGVETNAKGQTTALRLIDQNGKTKFIRNEDVILEFEIQKEIYEKQPTAESIQQAATELQVKPAERGQQSSEPVQQTGSVENIEGNKIGEPVILPTNEKAPLADQAQQNLAPAISPTLEAAGTSTETGKSGGPVVEVAGDQVVDGGQEVVGEVKPVYPIEEKGKWYGEEDYKNKGGELVEMTPDEFLSKAKPLEIDDAARDNIDDLKEHIKSGRKLDPLTLYSTDKSNVRNSDGRHRAIAAKELGISTVPVVDYTKAEQAKPAPSQKTVKSSEEASTGENDQSIEKKSKESDNKVNSQNESGTKQPVAGNRLFNRPIEIAKEIADRYFKAAFGTKRPNFEGTRKLDKERAKRIADAYAAMKHDPNNPEVKAAYEAMVKETIDQYKAILAEGYFIEINNEEAYANSEEMIEDLRNNKRMKIFSTESGYGDSPITDQQRKENPLLRDSGFKDKNGIPLLNNDVFRAVHDFFGHAELGNSFGALGEENAWNVHSRMYSPLARKAVTTETRGQNSYVNFSGVNQEAQKLLDEAAKLRSEGKFEEALKITESIYEKLKFADQKIGLLPEEFNNYDGESNLFATFDTKGEDARKLKPQTNSIAGYEFTNSPSLTEQDGLKVEKLSKTDANIIATQIFVSDANKSTQEGVTNEGGGWYSFDTDTFGGKTLYNKETGEAVELSHKKGGRMGVVVSDFVSNNSRDVTNPFSVFETAGEEGRKARAKLKESVGNDMFNQIQKAQKNAEKILRSMPDVFKIICP